jgi:hypothetical protein
MQDNVNDPYLRNSQKIFAASASSGIQIVLSVLISELDKLWRFIFYFTNGIHHWLGHYIPATQRFIGVTPVPWILEKAYKMIDKHLQTTQTNRIDLMQLMLESSSDEDLIQVITM